MKTDYIYWVSPRFHRVKNAGINTYEASVANGDEYRLHIPYHSFRWHDSSPFRGSKVAVRQQLIIDALLCSQHGFSGAQLFCLVIVLKRLKRLKLKRISV